MTDPVIPDEYTPDEPLCVRCGIYDAERPDRDGARVCKGCCGHDHVKTPGTTVCPDCVQAAYRETEGTGVVEFVAILKGGADGLGDGLGLADPDRLTPMTRPGSPAAKAAIAAALRKRAAGRGDPSGFLTAAADAFQADAIRSVASNEQDGNPA